MIGSLRYFKLVAMVLVLVGLVAGCSGKDGKDGINGTSGTNGANGLPGPPGTTVCMHCHTDSTTVDSLQIPQTEYADSKKALGDTYTEINSPCSGCHTTEGYQFRCATGQAAPAEPGGTRIGCFACHAPHTNLTMAQRKTGPTSLMYGGTSYNKQQSNTCAMCHQCRIPSPMPASVDSDIVSSRWGPHHGPQAAYLANSGAYQFSGATYPTNHQHATSIANGCVNCHMAVPVSGQVVGGHTFEVSYGSGSSFAVNSKACTGCHAEFSTDAGGGAFVAADSVKYGAALDSLKAMLVAKSWVNNSTDLVNASGAHPLHGLTADQRGAIYNYFYLDPDRPSGLAHNPAFEQAVLRATINFMKTQ